MTLDEAKEILTGYITPEGELSEYGNYLSFSPALRNTVDLEGQFTPDELEAIAIYARYQLAQQRGPSDAK